MRKQYELSKAAYAKRAAAVSKIPNFWPLVLEQAPMEIDQFIQTSDSRIFADSLVSINLTRPELEKEGSKGNPRSFKLRMEFKPNDDFEDTVLEKEFSHRRGKDGWSGLVSEPVKIHWKKGKDLTEGLTDGALALWEARKKAGDMAAKGLPEYTSLAEKVEHLNGAGTSFFTWFGWVSGHRYVTAEESAAANAEHAKKREALKASTKPAAEEEEDEPEDEEDDEDVEVHEAGEMLAVSFADDLWPNAIKFFTQAQEIEEMSDAEFEDFDEDDMDDEEGDEPIDIRSLVQEKGKNGKRDSDVGPPAKKQKK